MKNEGPECLVPPFGQVGRRFEHSQKRVVLRHDQEYETVPLQKPEEGEQPC